MTPERIEQERKAFEEWVTTLNNQTQFNRIQKQKDGRYTYDHIEFAWQTWQARAAQSEWISVEERLPDECNMVFIWLGGDDVTLSAYDSICGWAFIDQMDAEKVKFWSPVILPEPPETRGK